MKDSGENNSNEKSYRAPALEKGLDILELLAQARTPMTQNEIARALGRTVGEIFRMLSCLIQRGYVGSSRSAEGYELSLKLFELSHKHVPMNRLLSIASPVMKQLASDCDQSCHLAVYNNGHVMVVLQEDNPGSIAFSVRVGTLVNLFHSSSGPMLYAYSSDEVRAEMLSFHQQHHAEPDVIDPDVKALKVALPEILEHGIHSNPSSQVAGIYNYSCPILDFKGHIVAVLTIPYVRRLDMSPDREAELPGLLKAASLQISTQIAYN